MNVWTRETTKIAHRAPIIPTCSEERWLWYIERQWLLIICLLNAFPSHAKWSVRNMLPLMPMHQNTLLVSFRFDHQMARTSLSFSALVLSSLSVLFWLLGVATKNMFTVSSSVFGDGHGHGGLFSPEKTYRTLHGDMCSTQDVMAWKSFRIAGLWRGESAGYRVFLADLQQRYGALIFFYVVSLNKQLNKQSAS